MLVKSRVLRGNYDWHDILRRDCAQEIKRSKKPGLPERVRTSTQAVLLLAWGGLAKGNQSVQQAKARVASGKSKSVGVISQGLGPGLLGAWGPGHQSGLLCHQFFRCSEKSPGGRQVKGWETAETAAAEVGAWREAGTGFLGCKGEKKRVFTLSVTETIQHAPQGRRIIILKRTWKLFWYSVIRVRGGLVSSLIGGCLEFLHELYGF